MLVFAAGVILLCAERFAEALVATGEQFGIDKFLLVQWLAPLASEAPELLDRRAVRVAAEHERRARHARVVEGQPVDAARRHAADRVRDRRRAACTACRIDALQREELFLTAAQSAFAVAVLANRSISVREAWLLFGLFLAQFVLGAVLPESWHAAERIGVGVVYLLLGLRLILRDRDRLPTLLRDGFRTPHAELHAAPDRD